LYRYPILISSMVQFHFYYVYQLRQKYNSFVYTLKICLVSLLYHGPNNDEPQFFTNLQRKIESLCNSSVIIGGDWNVPLNYSMDTLYRYTGEWSDLYAIPILDS
jgi:hypothetical protein